MFIRGTIGLLGIFLATQLLTACCQCPDISEYNRNVEWTGISLGTSIYSYDRTGVRIVPGDTTDFTNALMAIRLTVKGRLLVMNCRKPRDWFGTAAYACKCDEITYAPVSPVTGLSVSTIYQFDAAHPTGSLVSPYFRSPGYDSSGAVLMPLALPNFPEVTFKDLDVSLLLAARPEMPGPQQFAVELRLANGTIFRDTTAVVRF